MSKAFKCDRCKQCFDPYNIPKDEYMMTISEVWTQTGSEFRNDEYGYRDDGIHLCPKCSEKFWDWWDEDTPEEKPEPVDFLSNAKDGISNAIREFFDIVAKDGDCDGDCSCSGECKKPGKHEKKG